MDHIEASTALTQAAQLNRRGRSASRWYARYLVLFGCACIVLAVGVGLSGGFPVVLIVTGLYVAVVIGLSVWSMRHRVVMRGMGAMHTAVIIISMSLWAVTVGLGTTLFADQLGWWLGGGLAMAAPAFIGAVLVFRRTQA